MTTTGRKYFSGDTLEQALMQAARHHGIKPEEVAYRKIEKRHGFLRARRSIVIEVDPGSPRLPSPEVEEPPAKPEAEEAAEAPGPTPIEVPEPAPEAEVRDIETAVVPTADLIDAAARGLKELLDFARLDLESEVSAGDGELEIELSGPDQDRLLEDRGNLLLAIQHLLPRLIRGYTGRSIPCHVDCQNFHEKRRVELKQLAQEAAQEVLRNQRPRTLPPMNPAERRIIHLTLAEDSQVVTESQGKGFFKRVMIRPAIRRPRGFDRYSR